MSQSHFIRSSSRKSRGAFSSQTPKNQNTQAPRVPPNNKDAECAVLSAIMTNKDSIATVIDIIRSADDFYDPRNAAIYQAILNLYEKDIPCNAVACAEELRRLELYEKCGGAAYLSEIALGVVSGVHVEFYAKIVRNKALQRSLIETCAEIIGNSYAATDDVTALLDQSEQAIFQIAERMEQRNFEPTESIIENIFDKLAKTSSNHTQLTGVTTGFTLLDHLTGGLQKSDLIIIAARPSMGNALCIS